jgi:predicted transcriptional regulator
MTTTTIRIDDDMKARVAAAAQNAGKTAHAFMVDAIAETLEQAEADEAFRRLGDERWEEVVATGLTVGLEETKAWLRARVRGENPPRPAARRVLP